MATANSLIIAAHGVSSKLQPGRIAALSTELIRVLNHSFNVYYAIGARINPLFYGVKDVVPGDERDTTLGWPRPACAEAVFRLELDDGTEVALVPFDQRFAEEGMPSVYAIGQHYVPAGNVDELNAPIDPDPATDDLVIFYSKRPETVTTLDDGVDPMWPGMYNRLPVLDVAIYLLLKDGQVAEAQQWVRERNDLLKLYIGFLEHADLHERRMFGPQRHFNSNAIASLAAALPGNAASLSDLFDTTNTGAAA
jgi:hypothetical protein